MNTRQVNKAFRHYCREFNIPLLRGKPQNDQPTTTRCIYVEFVDDLHRMGKISDQVAHNAHYF